ncbi:MAG: AI-2E family transporter [Myxococcales bacterium]|nr:AI-2E family transporter [Myxococcales bacterium]MCB9736709.1 AI-2E family transporter [Deltaproteobacteria bacterium]
MPSQPTPTPAPRKPRAEPPKAAADISRFASRLVLVLAVLVIGLVLWSAPNLPFLVLAAILFALLLDGLGNVIRTGIEKVVRHRPPRGAGIGLAALVILGVAVGTTAFLGPSFVEQAKTVRERLPEALEQLQSELSGSPVGRAIIAEAPSPREVEKALEPPPAPPGGFWTPVVDRAKEKERLKTADNAPPTPAGEASKKGDDGPLTVSAIFTSTFGVLFDLIIVLVLGIYLVLNPAPYKEGALRLVPVERRARVEETFGELEVLLKRWLAGRFFSMFMISLLTWVGLAIAGIPFAFALAVLAGALSFIPNFGPILSAIPGVLMGLLAGGFEMALTAGAVYLVTQMLESYIITPQVEKHAVSLPPAFLLLMQVMAGILFGALGLLLATPLTVIAITIIRRAYVEGVLEDDEDDELIVEPGARPAADAPPRRVLTPTGDVSGHAIG